MKVIFLIILLVAVICVPVNFIGAEILEAGYEREIKRLNAKVEAEQTKTHQALNDRDDWLNKYLECRNED